jgi:N-acetylmuramoyl-L-alanine amidase
MIILVKICECRLGKQIKGEYKFMNSKLHYKMFKAGKKWVFASIAAAGLGIVALDANATNVHADSNSDNDAADSVDDSTTTSPVSEASVTLTTTSLKTSSAASSSAPTSAASSAVSSSATKVATSSVASSSAVKSVASSAASSVAEKSVASSSSAKVAASSSASSSANTSVATSSSSVKNSSAATSAVAVTSNASSSASSAVSSSAIKTDANSSATTKSSSATDSSAVAKPASAAVTSKNKKEDKKSSKDYTIDNSHKLADDEGSDQQTKNNVIIAHATGTYSSAENVAIYEKREWDSSQTYVQYIVGDGGKVYAVGEEGYVAWGAGEWANENAPVQVELAQTYSDSQFKKDYQTYVNLLRDSAKKWNIPTTLDSDEYRGIKSHVWITNHVWGNHVDPYGYLSTHGISQAQFAHDLQYGFGSSTDDSKNNGGSKNNNTSNNDDKKNSNDNKNNKNNSSKINVGDKVTIKSSAKHWATGQSIYSAVKGNTYKVLQVNGSRLLLDKVLSWINTSDVTVAGSSSNHSSSNSNDSKKNNNNNASKKIGVGSKVTIKTSAKHWATGQSIYSSVKGKTYKVIQVNGNRLLLDKVLSWINKSDVSVPGSSSSNNSSSSSSSKNNSNSNKGKSTKITVGSKVTIKTSAKHWATGQTIYGAVKGKTYKVIQINGNRLLLDKVVSWINKGDVTVPGSSSSNSNSSKNNSNNSNKNKSNKIGVGSKVTIKTSAKNWATGQSIYSAVKGKTYKVIQVNGSRLLLDKVISWINKSDVTLAGSSSNSSSSHNSSSTHNVNVHLTNKHWTAAQTNFVNSIAADIVNVCNNNNLYASVAMAQAVLESAYGTSSLAQEALNLFGIKADSTWKGATYTKSTKEVINGRTVTVNASFRKYASIKDSIADYAKKLESRSQYANAFAPNAANYVAAIKAIKAGGYATSTTYVSSLVNCVNSNGFFKLDGLSNAIYL